MSLTFAIRSSALPDDARVAAFRGSEGLSRPHVFDIYVTVPGDDDIDLSDGIGSRVTLTIQGDDGPTHFSGVVGALELLRAVKGNSLYKVRLVPLLWQLSLTRHSRIFTKVSIPDLLKQVLDDEGVTDYELRLKGTYETEEHVCQYKESSLDFIHRWMEREGLYYFFEQSDSGEKLVIADDKSAHVKGTQGASVPYHPSENDRSAGFHFDHFSARHASLPSKVKLTDYNYVKPQLDVAGSATVSSQGFGEVRAYGYRFFSPAEGTRLANVRAEELRAGAATFHATGPLLGLSAGYLFTLDRHPKNALNTEYLVTAIEHFGFVSEVAAAWGKIIPHEYDESYRVDLDAILKSQQYRHPEVTPWPRIDGFENAIIDGAATSDYAQLDDHGRYSLKFKFDEGTLKDGKASTLVRQLQPHAGTVEGWHFPQRKGTEVLCAFLGGDPDRPVIVGAVPNAVTPSPVTSANHTRNVIQTGGRNRFELEDQSGQQRVTLSTPHANTYLRMGFANDDHELICRTDQRSLFHSGDTTNMVIGNEWTVDVTSDTTHTLNACYDQTVTSAVTHTFNDTHDLCVVGDTTHEHQADLTATVGGDHSHDVTGSQDVTVGGDHSHDTTGTHAVTVGGDHSHEVTGNHTASIGGTSTETTGGEHSETHGGWKVEIMGPTHWTQQVVHENILGLKSEIVAGAYSHIVLGIKNEMCLGARIDLNLAGRVNMDVPEAIELFVLNEKTGAFETHTKGFHAGVEAIHTKTHAAYQKASAAASKTYATVATNAALQNFIAALTNIM